MQKGTDYYCTPSTQCVRAHNALTLAGTGRCRSLKHRTSGIRVVYHTGTNTSHKSKSYVHLTPAILSSAQGKTARSQHTAKRESGQVRRAQTFRVAEKVYRLRPGAERHPDDLVSILFHLSVTHLGRWQSTVIPRKHCEHVRRAVHERTASEKKSNGTIVDNASIYGTPKSLITPHLLPEAATQQIAVTQPLPHPHALLVMYACAYCAHRCIRN